MEPAPLKRHTHTLLRAFTLLEMIVVTAIIGILLAVVITQERSFDNSTVLINSAYDLALSIRETQSLGLSSRNYGAYNNAGYGIDFAYGTGYADQFADIYPPIPNETSPTTACVHNSGDVGTPAERPGDCIYESADGEKVTRFILNSGYKIGNIRYIYMATPYILPASASLDIYFYRPNLQTVITVNQSGILFLAASSATISVVSPQGAKQCVYVNTLGEITILSSGCP